MKIEGKRHGFPTKIILNKEKTKNLKEIYE